VGLLFGAFAQHSRFCLRSATIEFSRLSFGPKLAVWLLAFAAAVVVCQGAVLAGHLDVSGARQIAATGSLSGAVIGGLMFGAGMILARGCASRLLVLSATGNLRALVTGLILTIVAQASLRGGWPRRGRRWRGSGRCPEAPRATFSSSTGLGPRGGLALGRGLLVFAVVVALRGRVGLLRGVAAAGRGRGRRARLALHLMR
jgi:uncharacterized protein